MTDYARTVEQDVDQLRRTIGAEINRWMHRLSCGDNVVSDEPEDSPMYCPGHGESFPVLGYSPYRDEEIA